MIQCETCLCWSHCECVGVTATCIPAYFKCGVCTKAQTDRTPEWSLSSLFDDESTSLFLMTPNNSEKVTIFLSCSRRMWNLREEIAELKIRYMPILRSLQNALRCDDLIELFKYANIQSDQLEVKIEQRRQNLVFFDSVALTLSHLVDCVCTLTSACSSSCVYIDLSMTTTSQIITAPTTSTVIKTDQFDVLISHLCDDEDTRQVRNSIQNRYDKLLSIVDNRIQTIIQEHQNIKAEMEMQLGIVSSIASDQLSYDAHELSLRTAIERLKC